MTGWLTADVGDLFGSGATAGESYGLLTVDVPAASWTAALETARSRLGCTYFDWLSAVDEPGTGFRVVAHVVALGPVRRLLLRTTVPHDAPVLASAVGVYAGAGWHERETHEMFGIDFTGHPHLAPLLLPDGFEGHPLRKDFVLAARVAKPWPGAKEPGESGDTPRRRRPLPPGVPDPTEWGPRGARTAASAPSADPTHAVGTADGVGQPGTAGGGGAVGGAGAVPPRGARRARDGRPRRMRTAAQGSVSQTAGSSAGAGAPAASGAPGSGPGGPEAPGPTGVSGSGPAVGSGATGWAPQGPGPAGRQRTGPRRARRASDGSVSQRRAAAVDVGTGTVTGAVPAGTRPATTGPTPPADTSRATAATRSVPEPGRRVRTADAPWHHHRPAFDDPRATGGVPAEPAPQEDPPDRAPQGRLEDGDSKEPSTDDDTRRGDFR